MRARRVRELNLILKELIEQLESKDVYTAQHSRNVHRYATILAERMKLPAQDIEEISIAGLLHDLGKCEVPYAIINKEGALSEDEFVEMKTHPATGDSLLEGFTHFESIRAYVRHHHERIDGFGYPDGLSGCHIPLGARILAVADAFDAMTTTRSYRTSLTYDEAIVELQRSAGTQLDEHAVECFITARVGLTDEFVDAGVPQQTIDALPIEYEEGFHQDYEQLVKVVAELVRARLLDKF